MNAIQPLKVIIFEDEVLLSNDLKLQIEPHNYHVIAMFRRAEAGLEFLATLTDPAQFPDVVLMDINLAGKMNGIEAARVITEKYHCALVFITGMSQKRVFDDAFNTKPHAFLIKPFDISQTLVSIRLAVYQNKLEKQLMLHQLDLESIIEERTKELIETRGDADDSIKEKVNRLRNLVNQLQEPLMEISGITTALKIRTGDNHPFNHYISQLEHQVRFAYSILNHYPA